MRFRNAALSGSHSSEAPGFAGGAVTGGGGSGGAASGGSRSRAATGGGSGFCVVREPVKVTPGAVIATTIGAGGAAATSTSQNVGQGNPGASTLFGSLLTVLGGGGGKAILNSSVLDFGLGACNGGDVNPNPDSRYDIDNLPGEDMPHATSQGPNNSKRHSGGDGVSRTSYDNQGTGGGAGYWGDGGDGNGGTGPTNSGAGGGGHGDYGAATSGAGQAGRIIIEW